MWASLRPWYIAMWLRYTYSFSYSSMLFRMPNIILCTIQSRVYVWNWNEHWAYIEYRNSPVSEMKIRNTISMSRRKRTVKKYYSTYFLFFYVLFNLYVFNGNHILCNTNLFSLPLLYIQLGHEKHEKTKIWLKMNKRYRETFQYIGYFRYW